MPDFTAWTAHAWHWWAAGVALALVEMITPGVGLLWLGVAAVLVGCVLFLVPALPLVAQVVLFAVLAAALLVITRRWLGRNGTATQAPPERLNERGALYLGRVVTLETAIVNGQGRARLDDGAWLVHGPDGLPAGAAVRVVGLDGTALRVEAA
ncbi:NfeD family protein [Nitrospirillum sp. BR 11828]|uniref:NfeD family protein n=1 Tax=Nitrospirillum sp. BR 11828 TaxID=3104325 RepID=UPI002ACA7CA2|nr:NfeD family protein [Nitrospirillum sp. BR 11828]MDZ5649297.1 NfeD family protein [Nitrospirillum sp. BR 11828]